MHLRYFMELEPVLCCFLLGVVPALVAPLSIRLGLLTVPFVFSHRVHPSVVVLTIKGDLVIWMRRVSLLISCQTRIRARLYSGKMSEVPAIKSSATIRHVTYDQEIY